MIDGMSGIKKLRKLANDTDITAWIALKSGVRKEWGAESGGERLSDLMRSIADQIEREHADELAAAKRDLADETREAVDVAALLELVDDLGSIEVTASSIDFASGYEQGCEYAAALIRKAVKAAPKKTNAVMRCRPCRTRREEAADWVERRGGMDVVRDYPKMDEFVAALATYLCVSDDIGCGDDLREAVMAELDKRLMPPGMTWPRWEDGNPLREDDAPASREGLRARAKDALTGTATAMP